MIKGKRLVAIIPARIGSKRLPGKNIKLLGGKPLIAWTIEAAVNSNYIDEVMVSTDGQSIANIAIQYGASVPFLRPVELAGDASSTMAVVEHVIAGYGSIDQQFEYVMLLQPTSPLRTADHINQACEQLLAKDGDSIVSVCPCDHSPLWSNVIPEDGSLKRFIDDKVAVSRSQDLPEYYRLNGAIYLAKIDTLLQQRHFLNAELKVFSYKMDTHSSIDIDNLIDFQLAEILIQA